MAKLKTSSKLSYLYLGILAFVTAMGLEVVSERFSAFTLPEFTMMLVVSSVYVLAATLFMAFITDAKIGKEQKYILYLVVLSLTFFKIITFFERNSVQNIF